MGQLSFAAVLIINLPDEMLSSMARDDMLTLMDAMRQMAGRPETDAALERLSRIVARTQHTGRSAAGPRVLSSGRPPRREPEAKAMSGAGR